MTRTARLLPLLVVLLWSAHTAHAATNTATAGTTWAGATWSLGHVPTSSEDVVINSGVNLTIGTAAVAGSLTIGNATATATTLTIGAGGSLVVSGTTGNLSINPSAKSVNMTLTVGTQTLSVAGTVSMAAVNTQTISVSTGTITFSSAVSLTTTNAKINDTSTGTINFNGGFTDGNAVLSEVSGSTINFGGNYTAQTAAVTWTAGSTAVFTGSSTITPTTAITFANVQINSGVTATLAGNISVAGNWTNNGGTLTGGSNTVSFSGTSNTIGGTGSTTFPALSFNSGSVYTMNNDNSCTSLTFVASATASSLTQASGTTLTVNGAVTINQPTASVTTAWNINAATATVSGLITFAGSNTTAARVGKIAITTGTLNANGGITFTASAAATKVIDMSGGAGTLNLKGTLTAPAASSTLTAGTSGSIFNYADTAAQTVNFFSAGAYNNLHSNNTSVSGATLGAAITTSNVTGNLRVQSGTFSNGGLAIVGNATKTFEVVNSATFKVAGTTSAFPTGFGTVTLGASSTVDYSGTLAQTISGQNYGNLTISSARGANNVTLISAGTIGVAGTFSSSATFSAGNGFITTSSSVTYNGTSAQTVTALSPLVSGSIMYNNLTINNSSGVTLSTSVTVGGTLTFTSGNITTGANSIYINATGSVSRTSGYVVGNLKKNILTGATNKTFEIGDASNYAPVTVSFASVTVAGDLTASTTTGDHPNISSSAINSAKTANRYWTLTNSGITFTTYGVTLNFVSGDLDSGANTSNFTVGKFSSGTWSYPTVGTRTATSTQATGITSFSDFEVGEASTAATWTGAVSNLWSNGGNWSGLGGLAPVAGDDLIFPGGASNLSTSNDIAAGTSFNSITISGSGYTLAGNSIVLAAGNLSDTNTSGSSTISLAISMSAMRTFSISNAAETLTISGVISGAGGLTQSGSGKMILSGSNSYNGATTISGGTLSISADTNLGTAPGSATAGQLTFGGGTLATTASFTLTANRGVAFNSTGAIDVASGTTLTYGGIAAGSSGFTKTSAGTLVLSGANTFTGATTINGGVVSIAADNNLGTAPGGATAGQLAFGGGTLATTASFALNANRGIAFNSTSTMDIASGTTLTYGGIAAGSGGLTKTSPGTLTLSGANTYTGATTIGAGILKLGANNSVPSGSAVTVTGTFDLAGLNDTIGSLAGGGTVTDSSATTASTLTAGGDNTSTTFSGVIQDGSKQLLLTKAGTGTLTLSGANTYTGATTISAGTWKLGANNSVPSGSAVTVTGTFDLAGLNDTIGSLAGGGTVTDSSATASTLTTGGDNTSTTFSGVIQNGSGTITLTKSGTGTFTLSGANTYTGVTTISAGTLKLGANNSVPSGSALTATSTFDLAGFNDTVGSLAGGGAVTDSSATTASTLTAGGDNSSTTFSGVVQDGSKQVLLTKAGTGTMTLSGTNTYTGATTINSGTLKISADNNLGTMPGSATAGQLTFGGGTLATTATFTLNSNRGISFSSTGTIDVASSATLTYGGIAAGAGGLTKTSAGTLTLSANNSYSGTTTISAGTLLVNGSQGSSAVNLNGGTLGGTGTVGAVTSTSSGGTVSPGSGPGILNSGNVNWSSGAPTFSIEINGTTVGSGYDQLNVTGTINLTGAALSGTTGFTPARGTTFTIIKNNTGGSITGTFSGLAEGATVSLSGQSFTISYVGGAGHDVVLTASGPNVTLNDSVSPSGSQIPGTDLAYTVTFTNSGAAAASSFVITDPIPANTDFKVGSVTNSLGTTGLTVVVAYSNDGATTWTYTPVSGGGGAASGYDRNVTNVRWTFTGNLSQTSPNNTGSVSFTSKIR